MLHKMRSNICLNGHSAIMRRRLLTSHDDEAGGQFDEITRRTFLTAITRLSKMPRLHAASLNCRPGIFIDIEAKAYRQFQNENDIHCSDTHVSESTIYFGKEALTNKSLSPRPSAYQDDNISYIFEDRV